MMCYVSSGALNSAHRDTPLLSIEVLKQNNILSRLYLCKSNGPLYVQGVP